MKKTYIAPELEIYKIEAQSMLATSGLEKKDNELGDDFEQYSQSFHGGILTDDTEDDN